MDFYYTSFPFGSYIMFSSRRIEIDMDKIVIPDGIEGMAKDLYEKTVKKMVNVYKKIKKETKSFDQARKVLPIGFVSRGFFSFPMQVILGALKEVKRDEDSDRLLPKEIKLISEKLGSFVKQKAEQTFNASMELIYDTNFPHPNLFKRRNFVYEGDEVRVKPLSLEGLPRIESFKKKLEDIRDDGILERVKKAAGLWKEFVQDVHDKFLVEVKLKGSIAVWNDLKRHRQ